VTLVPAGLASGTLFRSGPRWWLDTMPSLLIVMPLVAAADRESLQPHSAGPLEGPAWAGFFAAMPGLVLALPPRDIGIPTLAGMLPATAWAVTRMNLRYALAGALANALRHSVAQNIDVHLHRTEQGIVLTVRDDGRGCNPSAVRLGLGRRTLRLRADEIGAVLTVDATPGQGVCVECR
jgi:hypothetical protein